MEAALTVDFGEETALVSDLVVAAGVVLAIGVPTRLLDTPTTGLVSAGSIRMVSVTMTGTGSRRARRCAFLRLLWR